MFMDSRVCEGPRKNLRRSKTGSTVTTVTTCAVFFLENKRKCLENILIFASSTRFDESRSCNSAVENGNKRGQGFIFPIPHVLHFNGSLTGDLIAKMKS